MSTKELIDSAVQHLRTSASVKTVYGEPVVIDGKTIIPVAKVAYGFGGGTGTKKAPPGEAGKEAVAEAGEGAGGGVAAKPVGIVEVTGQETKFLPFGQAKKLAIAAAIGSGLGLVLGVLLGWRSKDR
ncbi:MAG TPA: spore germination protein GerW family protein [Gemmatimonadales bacterium]|nr:spore germination protein GerW family protein [Gemmatimonadales bacterium]